MNKVITMKTKTNIGLLLFAEFQPVFISNCMEKLASWYLVKDYLAYFFADHNLSAADRVLDNSLDRSTPKTS